MSAPTWLDIEQWYFKLRELPAPTSEIKLTNDQLNELKRNTTPGHLAQPGLLGIPIRLVDTVEESTPHRLASERLAHEAAYRDALNANSVSPWTIR